MDKLQLDREVNYGAAVAVARELLAAGLITSEEFCRVDRLYIERYRPLVQRVEAWKFGNETSKMIENPP